MTELEERLVPAIEDSYQPTWDHDRGEFTWGMGLDEPHPRGQFNAFLAAAEASGPGRWEALSAAPLEPCPQIVDVDFPAIALDRAEWSGDTLHLSIAPLHEDPVGRTSFRLLGVESATWEVVGHDDVSIEPAPGGLTIGLPVVTAEFSLRRTP
jgi:hypothetical protein